MKRAIACLIAAVCAGGAGLALSQAYPTKPIRIIAPFAPGGGTDFIARVAAQKLTEVLGQQVIVDNCAGDGVAAAGGTPEQFTALIKKDIELWRKVVQKAGVKAE